MSDSGFWKGWFFQMMDKLVEWQKHEKEEPLELLMIHVTPDYEHNRKYREYPEIYPYRQIKLIGYVYARDYEIQYAKETKFFDEMEESFEFGKPYPDSTSYAFFSTCGPISKDDDLSVVMPEIEKRCEARYPGAEIIFMGFDR